MTMALHHRVRNDPRKTNCKWVGMCDALEVPSSDDGL